MMEEQLKPCPFCGRKNLDELSSSAIPQKYFIGCPTCDFGFVKQTREEAMVKWNGRK